MQSVHTGLSTPCDQLAEARFVIQNIVIAGIGSKATGYKELFLPKLIATAAFNQGLKVVDSELVGDAGFRGSCVYFVKLGNKAHSNLLAAGQGDLIIGLEPVETLRATSRYAHGDTIVVTEMSPRMPPVSVRLKKEKYPDLTQLLNRIASMARKVFCAEGLKIATKLGRPEVSNSAVLGVALAAGLPVNQESLEEVIKELARRTDAELQIAALRTGRDSCREWLTGNIRK
jgi:indolepyruvate ferredoxin oxidoreductase beta subunit